ncbi:MAG TPA: FliH/SctL family protein [bacterium]|nr:FliH/SctL family protein [bacterium]
MSNLLKRSKVQNTNCVAFDLKSLISSAENELVEAGLSRIKKFEPASNGVGFLDGPPRASDTASAQSQANEIVRKAEARAAEILKEAKEEGLRLGKEEGAQSALEEARREAKSEVATVVAAFRAAVSELSSARREAMAESDTEMLALVLGITRLVLAREIRMDKTLIIEHIKRAAASLAGVGEITVKLHPIDLKVAQNNVDKLVPEGKSMRLSIVADKSVERGGCLLECNRGTVDARISTQLDRIKAAFEKVTESPDSGSEAAPDKQASAEEADDA